MSIYNKTIYMPKKPASKESQDWHPIDVVAAVRKTKTSLQRISRLHGLCSAAVGQALYRPYPKSERIIAEHLGITPQTIWPSRYNLDGSPKSGRGERNLGRHPSRLTAALKAKANHSTTVKNGNVNVLDNGLEKVAA